MSVNLNNDRAIFSTSTKIYIVGGLMVQLLVLTSMPQDFNFFLIFGHFVLLVPFEIFSCCVNINCSHWLREEIKWLIVNVFSEKLMI